MRAGCSSKQAFMGVTLPYRGAASLNRCTLSGVVRLQFLALAFEGGFDETTAPGVIAAPGALILCQSVLGSRTNLSTWDLSAARCLAGRFAHVLRFLDQRSSLLDTALHELRLDLGLLPCEQIHFRFKCPVPRKLNFDSVLSGADRHRMKSSAEFAGVSEEGIVYKDSRARRLNVHFQCCAYFRRGCSRCLLHGDVNELSLSGLHNKFLCEIIVAGLTNGKLVLAWKQQDLFRAFEFLQVSDILSVNPDAGGFFHLRSPIKIDLAHHLILPVEGCGTNQGERNRQINQQFPEFRVCAHANLSFRQKIIFLNPTVRWAVFRRFHK